MKVFYSDDYVAAAYEFTSTRKAKWIAASLHERPIAGVELVEPLLFGPLELIESVHTPRYVEALRTGEPRELAETQGFDWDPGLWRQILAEVQGFCSAVEVALTDGVSGSLGGAFHHATRAHGDGFCSVNGLIIGLLRARQLGAERVLILDLDAHCGGGTEYLLGRITIPKWDAYHLDISVSRYGFDRYSPQRGTLDILLDADLYLRRLDLRLQQAQASGAFDLCLYFSGMDVHYGSAPGGLDNAGDELLCLREERVFAWCRERQLPVAFVVGGGYTSPLLSEEHLVDLHRMTLHAAVEGRWLQD